MSLGWARKARTARPLRSPWFWGALAAAWLGTGDALAAGDGKPVTKIVNVIDTRNMAPGLVRWVSDVYNTNLWLYGLLVVCVMAAMGAVLGTAFDKAVGLLGIDLGRLDHHE